MIKSLLHNLYNYWKSILLAIAVGIILSILAYSNIGDYFENYIAHALQLEVRDKLKKYPKISTKIKTFVFDDQAVSVMKTTELDLDSWYKMFAAIDKQKPRAIIVDKVFGIPNGDINRFNRDMKKIKTPIILGAYSSENIIKGKIQLTEDYEKSSAKSFTKIDNLNTNTFFIYGTHELIRDSFSGFGHIVYGGNAHYFPYYRYSQDRAIPHLSLLLNPNIKINSNHLELSNGDKIHYDRFNRLIFNHAPNEHYPPNTYSANALYLRAFNGKPISVVEEDDIVLILPLMFTGHTDWLLAPGGHIPGGYLLHSSIQAAIEERFVKKLDHYLWVWIFLITLCAFALVIQFDSKKFWISYSVLLIAGISVSILYFVHFWVFLPWFYPSIQFALSGLIFNARKIYLERDVQLRMQHELATAQTIQEYFYPKSEIHFKCIKGYGKTNGATECSGDLWYYQTLNDRYFYLGIGDVMGHGTSAALVTALAYGQIKQQLSHQKEPISPEVALNQLNQLLFHTMKSEVTMTFFLALIDTQEHKLHFANAGHNFPFLITLEGDQLSSTSLKTTASNMGVSVDLDARIQTVSIDKKTRIVCFSDGLIENELGKQKTMSRKKLLQIIESTTKHEPESAHQSIMQSVQDYFKTSSHPDDVSLIVLDYLV